MTSLPQKVAYSVRIVHARDIGGAPHAAHYTLYESDMSDEEPPILPFAPCTMLSETNGEAEMTVVNCVRRPGKSASCTSNGGTRKAQR